MVLKKITIFTNKDRTRVLCKNFFQNNYDLHFSDVLPLMDDLAKVKPDLIFMDDELANKEIFSIILKLRTNNDLKFTPLFIITKHLNKDYLDKLRIVGADNFFMEPLNQAIIEKEISDALKQKNEEKKLSQIYPLSSQMSDKKTLHEKAIYDKAIFDEVSDTLRKKREFSLLAIEALDIESSKFTEVQISDVMKRALGENGKLIALGHGKYVAFLLQTSNEYALFAAKSLHDILHSILKIKLVIGICSQNKSHYVNIQDMLKDAKTALYNAKNKGVFFEVFS